MININFFLVFLKLKDYLVRRCGNNSSITMELIIH